MKVLIVGCGYVGSFLGAELVRRGHQVSGLRRSLSAAAELQASGIHLLAADITRFEDLERLPPEFDWVINTVAASGGGPDDYAQTYLAGTRNLVRWLAGSPLQKFVYTSSTGVYGQDDASVVDETSPTEPASPTGKILIQTEAVLREAAEHSFPAVILRVAGIYGPGRGYWLRQFLAGEAVIEGDGSRFLNMVHRDDVAGAAIAALERGTAGEVCNVCDDEPVAQRDLFAWLAARLQQSMPSSSAREDAARRRGATNKRVSNRKLRESLAYQPAFPTFREGYEAEIRRLSIAGQP
jgi:nucleoside-diphosphate-sugar epimerase